MSVSPPVAKPIISVGQALLLLIDEYQESNPARSVEIKKLYLSGAVTPNDKKRIRALMKDSVLKDYFVSEDPKVIDADPTRRYFETHLAFETQNQVLAKVGIKQLEDHQQFLFNQLPKVVQDEIKPIFEGDFSAVSGDLNQEFSDFIHRVETDDNYHSLSKEERDKIKALAKCGYLAVRIAQMYNKELPLNIYGTGMYAADKKGKTLKKDKDQKTVRTQHMGIVRGHMPLPRSDAAFSEQTFGYLKPSEQAGFQIDAEWVRNNFSRLVHPFSNSISGTILAQLRLLLQAKLLEEQDKERKESKTEESTTDKPKEIKETEGTQKLLQFDTFETLQPFLKLFISGLLYNSGGHTLLEFTTPLQIKEIREAFSFIPDFHKMSLPNLFYYGNERAFNKALKDTIAYNKTILNRHKLQDQLSRNWLKSLNTNKVNSLLRSSEYYIGDINSINTKFIANSTAYLCHDGATPLMIIKNREGTLKYYVVSFSEKGIELKARDLDASIPIVLDHPKDFDRMIEKIAESKECKPLDKEEYQATFTQKGLKMLMETKSIEDAERIVKSPWFLKNINLPVKEGDTILTALIKEGDNALVKLLLQNGASLNLASGENETPLLVALQKKGEDRKKDGDMVNLILSFVKDINKEIQPEILSTILFQAIEENNIKLVKTLLDKKISTHFRTAEDDYSPLMVAVNTQNVDMAILLLKNPEIKKGINDANRFDELPLLTAVNKTDKELVKILLVNGADPTIPKNPSLLEIAVSFNDLAITELLLADRRVVASINELNEGETVLSLAEKSNVRQEIKDLLVSHGAKMPEVEEAAEAEIEATEEAEEVHTLLLSGGPEQREKKEGEEEKPKGTTSPEL